MARIMLCLVALALVSGCSAVGGAANVALGAGQVALGAAQVATAVVPGL